jgi:hypothetical protein
MWNLDISKKKIQSTSDKFYFFLNLFICAYIVWTISFACLFPRFPLVSGQNLFCPLLQFCWREDMSNNRRDSVFLLVWHKDSYTERFLALLPCTCALPPEFVHLYQTSSLLPCHLPILTSVILRLLYYLLYSGHIKQLQVLGFLPFPIPPVCVLPLACDPCPILLHSF